MGRRNFGDFLNRRLSPAPGALLLVVPGQVFGNFFLPDAEVSRKAVHTLVLDGPVEPLEVGVVVRGSYPAVPMCHAALHDPFVNHFENLP